jgi:hypothetical protein
VGGSDTSRNGAPIVSNNRIGNGDLGTEAARNYELNQVGALGPNVAGKTGAGIKVGIIDTGIDLNHPDFAGAIDAASTDIISGAAANVQDQAGHGTAVASIIGARADGYDVRGIAPGSTLLAVRSESSCSSGSGCTFYNSDLARATDYANAHGAKIINYSLGGNGVDPDWQAAMTRFLTPGTLADGVTPDPAKEHIIVAAAGNSGGANPLDPAAWLAANGQGRGIAVGAVDSTGTLAAFSNKAGTAKDHYLVASGVNVVVDKLGGGVTTANGTSFATPAVTGAAAVVWGASPFLTGKQVVDILLNSATDLGVPGVDDVYGHGLLNLNAALQPVGGTSIPTGTTVSSGGAQVTSTSLSLGNAFGNAMNRGSALSQAIVLDAYGRPFHMDLSGTVQPRPKSDPLGSWLGPTTEAVTTTRFGQNGSLTLATPYDDLPDPIKERPGDDKSQPHFALSTEVAGTRLGLARGFGLDEMTGLNAAATDLVSPGLTGNALSSPYLALSGSGTAVSAGRDISDGLTMNFGYGEDGGRFSSADDLEPSRKAALAELTKQFRNGSVLGAQLGNLTEAGGPLASSAGGAFGFDKPADTVFLGFFGATPVSGKISLFGRAGMGWTDGKSLNSGLMRDVGTVTSQSFALGATVRDVGLDDDNITFSTSKPLRVNSGSGIMAVPVGRTLDGTILTQEQRVKLSPTGSETDFELSWTIPTGERQHLIVGGLMALEPGHDASAGPAFATGAKYRLTW